MRRTTTTVLLAAVLALAGCSSDAEPEKVTATVTATPTVSPSLSRAETTRLCTDAVAEAAPGWTDWNFNPGAWQDDPRTPAVCQGLADKDIPSRGNRDFMGALLAGLELADDPRAGQ